jgi:5-methylcytosine-specific restriction endonuclease McrA
MANKRGQIPWNKGKKLSEEHRAKIKKNNCRYWLGKKRSSETIDKIRKEKLGKKLSEEHKRKISKACGGEKCWNWKGGISRNEKEYHKKYREAHKNNYSFYARLRHYKVKGATGSHTFGEWETLKAQCNWACLACKRKEPEIKLTEDHIIQISKGGSNNIENIQPLCVNCNSKKHTKVVSYMV